MNLKSTRLNKVASSSLPLAKDADKVILKKKDAWHFDNNASGLYKLVKQLNQDFLRLILNELQKYEFLWYQEMILII